MTGVTWDDLRAIALALPGVEETTLYGTPALRVGRKTFLRLREDGASAVLHTDAYERDHLLATDPATFFVTPHYDGYPVVLVRLAAARAEALRPLLLDAWRRAAPKRLLSRLDGDDNARSPPPGRRSPT